MIGAVGIRGDGAIVTASNGPVIIFNDEKKGSFPEAHAEIRLSRKLDVGSIVYVARVRKGDGMYGNARPCKDCRTALKARGVKKVFYTIGPNEYGIWYPQNNNNEHTKKLNL